MPFWHHADRWGIAVLRPSAPPPVGAAVVSPVGASPCVVAHAARRCSVHACQEHWPERRRRRGAEGPAASVLAGVGVPATGATGTGAVPVCRRARSSLRLVIRMR
jgi:hypothetical protein